MTVTKLLSVSLCFCEAMKTEIIEIRCSVIINQNDKKIEKNGFLTDALGVSPSFYLTNSENVFVHESLTIIRIRLLLV